MLRHTQKAKVLICEWGCGATGKAVLKYSDEKDWICSSAHPGFNFYYHRNENKDGWKKERNIDLSHFENILAQLTEIMVSCNEYGKWID